MKKTALALSLLASTLTLPAVAAEGPTPKGIPHLEHVFLIMMENHGYGQILNNPNAPFINKYAKSANLGTNYFAIAHPSLTNYLEVVGGSNFGVQTDNYPDWHNATCTPEPRVRDDGHGQPSQSADLSDFRDRHRRGDARRRLHERDPGPPRRRSTSTASSPSRPSQVRWERPSPISSPRHAGPGRATRRTSPSMARTA